MNSIMLCTNTLTFTMYFCINKGLVTNDSYILETFHLSWQKVIQFTLFIKSLIVWLKKTIIREILDTDIYHTCTPRYTFDLHAYFFFYLRTCLYVNRTLGTVEYCYVISEWKYEIDNTLVFFLLCSIRFGHCYNVLGVKKRK